MLTYKIRSINDTRYLAKVEIYTSIRSLGSPSLALPPWLSLLGSPTWLSHLALPPWLSHLALPLGELSPKVTERARAVTVGD